MGASDGYGKTTQTDTWIHVLILILILIAVITTHPCLLSRGRPQIQPRLLHGRLQRISPPCRGARAKLLPILLHLLRLLDR